MTYSKTHKRFADRLNNQRALERPEDYLGSNWKDVLNFWWFLDGLSEDQWEIVRQRYWALDDDVWDAARDVAAWVAAAAAAAFWAACYDVGGVKYGCPAGYATYELIGSHILLEQQKALTNLSLFLDL
jgi:carbohydrate-binding DOMON domain-containing protein